jgi:hypothetical protein
LTVGTLRMTAVLLGSNRFDGISSTADFFLGSNFTRRTTKILPFIFLTFFQLEMVKLLRGYERLQVPSDPTEDGRIRQCPSWFFHDCVEIHIRPESRWIPCHQRFAAVWERPQLDTHPCMIDGRKNEFPGGTIRLDVVVSCGGCRTGGQGWERRRLISCCLFSMANREILVVSRQQIGLSIARSTQQG